MKITVDVETKTFARLLLVASGFAAAGFLAWQLWPAIMIIAVAFFLALALNPPVSLLSKNLPGQSRVLATGIAYLVVLAVVGAFVYIALPPLIDQLVKFFNALPHYVQELSEKRGVLADLINRYGLQAQVDQLVAGAQQQASNIAGGIGSSLVSGVSLLFNGLLTLLTVLVLTFFMLVEGPRWAERVWSLYTDDERMERHKQLVAKMNRVVAAYINGQVFVAAIAGAAGLTTLLVMSYFFRGIPYEAVFALAGVIFFTDLVPVIGATIGAIIVSLVLLFNDPASVIVFIVYFLIYQQIENNFIQPLVQSRSVALSALGVIMAVIVGITLLGVVGGIVAIPVAGCVRVAILDYMEHRTHKPEKDKPGLISQLVSKVRGAN